MCSAGGLQTSLWRGCPIRTLRAHDFGAAPPERFAGLRVLHRPSAPRHPPGSLSSLYSRLGVHVPPGVIQERWIGVINVFVCYPLLRFCWRLLGKIEVILFSCSGTSSGAPTPEEWKVVQRPNHARAPRLPARSPHQIDLG